jgi:hypothetical protein
MRVLINSSSSGTIPKIIGSSPLSSSVIILEEGTILVVLTSKFTL